MSNSMHRRNFVRRAVAASCGFGLSSLALPRLRSQELATSPNEQVLLGFIGCGNRARQLMDQVPEPGRIVAVADCDLNRAAESVAQRKSSWKVYQNYRQMLERESLDAVVVATPDHVRTLPCIHAVQAGLDVYAEKPLTAYVREGRRLVDAVRRHDRILQVGSQQRTMEINRFCCEFIRDGKIGTITKVSAVNYPGPRRWDQLPAEAIPEGLDWDMWCGPTELRPYHHQLHSGWMQWRDYSGGQMTNWGAHGVDQIQWALGKDHTGPTEFWSDEPGPNGKVSMRYADGTLVAFEREKAPMGGGVFVGTQCKMEINRNRFATNPPDFVRDAPPAAAQDAWEGEGWIARPHLQNWLDCIKSRQLPNADVEVGHRTVTICHLLNLTRELGRPLQWDPEAEAFVDDDAANALLDRPRREGYELLVA